MKEPYASNPSFYRERSFTDACIHCANKESIYRSSEPHKKYPKNHSVRLEDRVHPYDQAFNDWVIYDPNDC